jgi:hypothetical protein
MTVDPGELSSLSFLKRSFQLLLILSLSACGYMPSRYDQIALDCGGDDAAVAASSGHLVKLESDGQSYDPTRVSAKWYERGSETTIAVSFKACIPTPKTSGVLKLVSDDRRFGMRLRLPESQTLSFKKVTLKTLQSANFRIKCRDPMLLRSVSDFAPELEWDELEGDDFWQIDQIRYQILQEGEAIAASSFLFDPEIPNSGRLALGPLQLKDGRYVLRIQAETIAEDAVNAANSCSFDLDQTAPAPTPILGQKISPVESPLPLQIGSGPDLYYYCIGGEDKKGCERPEDYKIASEFIATQASGAHVLYSYSMDAAGNASNPSSEAFFRDATAPVIHFQWLNHHLRQNLNWAVEPNQTYAFQVAVDDDSVTANFMSSGELQGNTVCRVSYMDQAGGRYAASQAICTEGRCEGKSMEGWVPCDGLVKFQFQEDALHTLFGSQIQIEVKSQDLAARQSQVSSDFWVNPTGFSSWTKASVDLPFRETELNFINDNFGRFLAFSNSTRGPNQIHPTLFYKQSEESEWSPAIAIQTPDVSIFALREQDMLLTRSLKPEVMGDSLWLRAGNREATLIEVPLGNETRGNALGPLQAQAFPIPTNLLDLLGRPEFGETRSIQGMAEYTDSQGRRKLIVLVRLGWEGLTASFAFLSFDGREFTLLGESKRLFTSSIINVGPGLMSESHHRVVLLINSQLAVFDPNQGTLSFPTLNPRPQHGLRSLYKDKKGFYGLTSVSVQPFTLTFHDDASSVSLHVLQAEDTLKGIRDINHLVRKSDGSFWMSAMSASVAPVLYSWKPWSPSRIGWLLQDGVWNWSTAENPIWSFGLGIDQNLDQVAVSTLDDASSGRKGLSLRMMRNNNFIEVSDQGLLRPGLETQPTQKILLAQDKTGNLIRLSYWRTSQDGYIAVSKLGDSGPAKNISLKPLVGGSAFAMQSAINSMFVDRNGAVWFEDALSGEVKRLDLDKGVFIPQFALTPAIRKWRMFDSQGNYWASLGLGFTEIQLRRPDDSRRTLKLEDGYQGDRIIWNEPHSWILARHSVTGASKLFALDLQAETIREDRNLDQDDFSFADIIPFQDKRLALVRAGRVNGEDLGDLAQLMLYEDDGSKWVEWDRSMQPKFPDWHARSGKGFLVKNDRAAEAVLFHESGVVWIAGAGEDPRLPILARMPLDTKTWTVFSPGVETVKAQVQGFWRDPQHRLVLNTATQIFYFNPASSSQDKWLKIVSP